MWLEKMDLEEKAGSQASTIVGDPATLLDEVKTYEKYQKCLFATGGH